MAARGDSPAPPRAAILPSRKAFSPIDILLIGVWFALATGLFELAVGLASIHGRGVITYDTLRTNWHHVWMVPLSYAALFLAPVTAAVGLALAAPRFRRGRAAIGGFAALSAWSLALGVPGLNTPARLALAGGLAAAATRLALGHPDGFRRLVRATAPAGLVLVALAAAGATAFEHHRGPSATPAKGDPNVVVIVLDTVRADSLTPYGSERDVTPNLARLAREGVLFRNARSTASWTLPAHASLFTGRFPSELSVDVGRPLDGEFPTLAERLSARGFATAGFVANLENCNAWYGLDRGFDHYEDFYENDRVDAREILRCSRLGRFTAASKWGAKLVRTAFGPGSYQYRKSAAMINRDALAWLDARPDDGRPFFMFLNYFDAHDPYIPPADASRKFSAGTNAPRDAYDDCLAYLDGQIGRLLDDLDRRGLRDDTMIVVTADHGESFGEHGLAGHGISLYRAETHIPLIVVAPGKTPRESAVDRPVSLRDVAPTILDLLGDGPGPFPGPSLSTAWQTFPAAELAEEDEPVFLELDRAEAVPDEAGDAPARLGTMRSLVAGRHAYILNGDGGEELYDIKTDPEERQDLASLPESRDRLRLFRDLMRPLIDVD
ncbi:sulfatase [Paludisphaera rhizosphaerae]|uniref:sulfatase n=1 Tax=Paludisphaera rhizosphaerae TaxID=2711216 RepID=UPI0013EA4663|nr:sulfatase [Paludisphaera rhizosphaerae]